MVEELKKLTVAQRNAEPEFIIDPGYINYRYIFSVFGTGFLNAFTQIQKQGDDWMSKRANDHYIMRMLLATCKRNALPTLGEIVSEPHEGQLFCSIENLQGTQKVYTSKKDFYNQVILPFKWMKKVKLRINPSYFVADTGMSEQSNPSYVAIIGRIQQIEPELILKPLLMGAPMLDPDNVMSEEMGVAYMWYGSIFYENTIEDIDEFASVRGVPDAPREEWLPVMKQLREEDVKIGIAQILGDEAKKDWGGETNDYFSARVHLSGRKHTAAFAFKGPGSGFSEMTLKHLGKNQDQIIRLANSEANLLVVQHCHDIGENVRTTLRHFAVTFSRQRRYCLIDGQETYKLLKTYGKIQ